MDYEVSWTLTDIGSTKDFFSMRRGPTFWLIYTDKDESIAEKTWCIKVGNLHNNKLDTLLI